MNKNNIIYRIEHASLKTNKYYSGPYGVSGHFSAYEWAEDDHDLCVDAKPLPDNDPILINEIKANNLNNKWVGLYLCGFTSLSQLKQWFTNSEINNLRKLGFVIVKYKAQKVLNGKTQVLFIPQETKRRSFIHN